MLNKRIPIILAVIILCSLVYIIGYHNGKEHVITDSEIYTDNQYIYIEIDNNLYIHNR